MGRFRELLLLTAHIAASVAIIYLGLYIVQWMQVPETLLIVTLFLAAPLTVLGGLQLMFEGYARIPFLGLFLCGFAVLVGAVLAAAVLIR